MSPGPADAGEADGQLKGVGIEVDGIEEEIFEVRAGRARDSLVVPR
ncbi:MAG: hypothetical protein JWM83_3084 [Candidatus Angelobacter sp.]|jgi:hypothetical protein|nr:hypothetical protein [Candidatus Angelobacter sp.]